MGLPPDSIVEFTLSRMQNNLANRTAENDVTSERSGLLFLGNVHDAFPRQLFMDTRLSPLDKTAWVMIRLYAQQNEGAVFPTYDELQLQLASPHAEKASRETISRVLLMLRITGWLSLCKRVRDARGRVRGNIYAQHDEPLSCRDAETFDPGWLDLVASSCQHRNKAVRMTAMAVLADIKNDPTMRHRHSRLAMIDSRLGSASTPREMASLRGSYQPGSVPELSIKSAEKHHEIPGSDTELSEKEVRSEPGSDTQLSLKSVSYAGVRKSNRNVRIFTQGVNKKTYVSDEKGGKGKSVSDLPESLTSKISAEDAAALSAQLDALPEPQSSALMGMLKNQLRKGQLTNPMGWMLAMLKRARDGQLMLPEAVTSSQPVRQANAALTPMPAVRKPAQRASAESVSSVIADIRNAMLRGSSVVKK
ncbi:STY4528 family pathogenicity island replication protein [Rahnella sp. ChDrAdgB13]|uniref:STY4528 family pathogenicity island replication protein n=1 Tax=Rahnella sp. ChDrAdgB13 TaxID=1850581 RepID=UPI001AD89935|nr:STY4528 family pathogenicity island replication protein [Rahnella sp. ChDrAdgB13]